MPPKNTFTIPMGDVVEVVNQTRKTKRGLCTTVKEVPFHLKKGKSGQASMSQTGVETTMETVQSQSSRDSPHGIEESHTLHHIEPYEPDLQDFQAEESQPQQSIHPPVARDGGSDKCSKLLYVYQFDADQVLQLYWRKGHQASDGTQRRKRTSCQTRSASLVSVEEEQAHSSGDTLFDFAGDVLDPSEGNTRRTRTTMSGNPLITVVNQTGVFDMDVLFCICPNAGANDEQLLQAGIFPSTFKQIETAFTFSVLDDFLADNLECKTTAQQYYSKLQSITNRMFPDHVPPGINLPDDWRTRYNDKPNQLIRTFIMDGNFSAEHMRCRTGDTDVPLSAGMAFMANPNSYKAHLHSGQEISQPSTCNTYRAIEQANSSRPHLDVTGIRATTCCHGFFVPTSVVDFQKGERQINMDYSLCKALSYNMGDIPVALVMYDIMCQYGVHFKERVEKSPELSLSSSLQLHTGIGLFHIHGHQDSCLPRFSPSYIPGAKQVDGEIIETLWAPLNNISRSICGMSLAHCQEVLDAHMNHSNWKKMVRIVPSLLKRWKWMDNGIDLSAEILDTLNARHEDPTLMDIYDTVTSKAPSRAEIQQQLILEESGDITAHGQTSWIACGIKIQELQLAIRYQLRAHGLKINTEEAQCLWVTMRNMTMWMILEILKIQMMIIQPMPPSVLLCKHWMDLGWMQLILRTFQSSSHLPLDENGVLGMVSNPLLERRYSYAMLKLVNPFMESASLLDLNPLCSALSMARDAYRKLRKAAPIPQDLPKLHSKDLHVATLVLGSQQVGQRNTQQSWIWGFGNTTEDDGTWMDDFERVHWLRARAQFERWSEEQDSIHNEAKWIPAYFHSKAETWKKLMIIAAQGSLKGHQAYASYQMHAWEGLSRSSVKALTLITDAPLKHCKMK
ncbi:hypothetical protein H4582DRAFT_2054158 [Lactarius indigo]|nr:hypothetical protein H4582DRAFT_2054158 [Lactarius indigo]